MSPFATLSLSIALAVGGFAYGVKVTNTQWKADTQTAINEAVAEARLSEQRKQDLANENTQNQIVELNAINNQLTVDLDGLRNRPGRKNVSDDTTDKCKGSSGRQLSRQDAEFLTREAARADKIRTGLIGCYNYEELIHSE